MDILFLLIPLSAVLVLAILAVFASALKSGQFDDLESAGRAVLELDGGALDADQGGRGTPLEQ